MRAGGDPQAGGTLRDGGGAHGTDIEPPRLQGLGQAHGRGIRAHRHGHNGGGGVRLAQGLPQAAGGTFRAVLLDLTMPHLDGVETFRELRRLDPDCRVILTSGYNEQEAIHDFLGKGLAGFVQKPFLREDLLRALRKALEGGPSA